MTKEGSYSSDIPTGTAVGDYTVWYRVKESADYKGVSPVSINAVIGKADITNAEVTLGAALTYTGSTLTQTVGKVMVGTLEVTDSEYLLSENTAINAGNYKLRITAAENSNYKGYKLVPFTVAKKEITPTIDISGNHTYTGNVIKPAFTVKDGAVTLTTKDYTFSYADNINAGSGKVIINATSGGNYAFPETTAEFTIAKAAHEAEAVSINALYGAAGSLDLSEYMEAGGSLEILTVSDNSSVLEGNPAIAGNSLTYRIKDSREIEGKSATVTVNVKNADNYEDYNIKVSLTVINCAHIHTELRNIKEANCTEEGYSGDLYCQDCGTLLEKGKVIPINKDNHSFDDGLVIKEATGISEGLMEYTCKRCGHKKYEVIPRLENDDNYENELIEDTKNLSGNAAPQVEKKTGDDGSCEETVSIGGQEVSKTVTNSENEIISTETKVWITGLQKEYRYTSAAIKPAFRVYDGTKKLTEKTDYTVKYSNNKNCGDAAVITVTFKGNYKGQTPVTTGFTITPAILGEDIIAHETAVAVSKKAQIPLPVLTWASSGKTANKKFFSISYDREVKDAGEYTATITSTDKNYSGTAYAKVTVTGDSNKLLSKAKVRFTPNSYAYTGSEIIPAQGSYKLTIGSTELKEGDDYKVAEICNNTNPGTATVIFKAISDNKTGYVGSKAATFRISGKKAIDASSSYTFKYSESVPYAKGGSTPSVRVYDGDTLLTLGTDYSLSYKKNKAVTNGEKTAQIILKGKGKYKGTLTLYFAIKAQELSSLSSNILVKDQFTTKEKVKNPSVVIKDLNGKKLAVNKDFTIDPDMTIIGDETNGTVTFNISGKNNYTGPLSVSFRYMDKSADLSRTKSKNKIADQTYTGKEITLPESALKEIIYTGSKSSPVYLLPGKDFEVFEYTGNIKKGTAKVTLKGIGQYAGTRTLTFKILQKDVDYKGTLIEGQWQ